MTKQIFVTIVLAFFVTLLTLFSPRTSPAEEAPKGFSPVLGRAYSLPPGHRFYAILQHPLSSKLARVGDPVQACLPQALRVEGYTLAQAGSSVTGLVEAVEPYLNQRIPGYVQLRFYTLKPLGERPPIEMNAIIDATDNTQGRLFADRIFETLPEQSRLYRVFQGLRNSVNPASGEFEIPVPCEGIEGPPIALQERLNVNLPKGTVLPLVLDKTLTLSPETLLGPVRPLKGDKSI